MKTIKAARGTHCLTRFCIFLTTVALVVGMVGCDGCTPSQNLEIQDWHDLDAVRLNLGGHHVLMNDLDSSTAGYAELAGPTANGGKGWEPIGTCLPPSDFKGLTGTLDGQGYEIRDLFINRPDEDLVGLFGVVIAGAFHVGGVVKNVGVVNVTVIGNSLVGGLVATNLAGTVSNSSSSGNVTGGRSVGGLVGENHGTVSNSYSTSAVAGHEDVVGGLVGYSAGTVSNSYSTGKVTGDKGVGGLEGWNYGTVTDSYSIGGVTGNAGVGGLVGENLLMATVSNSYSTGNVRGSEDVGGLVGSSIMATVNNTYSCGNVIGDVNVGGLVGENKFDSTVSNSYSTGSVTGNSTVGGLVGWNNDAAVSDSFWDTETSGQAISDGGTGKTTAETKSIATFSTAGWNIIAVANPDTRNLSYIWNIVNGATYPFLSWQPP
jgi:hypothetical protein